MPFQLLLTRLLRRQPPKRPSLNLLDAAGTDGRGPHDGRKRVEHGLLDLGVVKDLFAAGAAVRVLRLTGVVKGGAGVRLMIIAIVVVVVVVSLFFRDPLDDVPAEHELEDVVAEHGQPLRQLDETGELEEPVAPRPDEAREEGLQPVGAGGGFVGEEDGADQVVGVLLGLVPLRVDDAVASRLGEVEGAEVAELAEEGESVVAERFELKVVAEVVQLGVSDETAFV
jgi:hypothetical protein